MAVIRGIIIAVVTCFHTDLDDTVTATGQPTTAQAAVGIEEISVVTGFIGLNDAIATRCIETRRKTGIGVVIIAIITLLTGLNDAITTRGE